MENTNRLFLSELVGLTEEGVKQTVACEFEVSRDAVSCYEFYVATIEQQDYEGHAYFLMKHQETGDFYEVEGGHCSCFGFEGQWEPKIAPKAYLGSEQYSPGYSYHKDEIKQFVKQLFS
jgi:hypothetical protein